MITTNCKAPVITAEDMREFRKIALRPTLAAICEQIYNAGFDVRDFFAARRVLSARDMGYWHEFIACALPSDWLIWATEINNPQYMMEYYHDSLAALRKS